MASSRAAGISVHGMTAIVGLVGRFDRIGARPFVERTWVIAVALLLSAVEFAIDEVALIESMWDGVHTFVRPAIGGYLASSATDTELSVATLAVTGVALAFGHHRAEASTRLIVNSSPEPLSNVAVGLGENGMVAELMTFALTRPELALVLTAMLAIVSTVVTAMLFRTVPRITRRVRVGRTAPPLAPGSNAAMSGRSRTCRSGHRRVQNPRPSHPELHTGLQRTSAPGTLHHGHPAIDCNGTLVEDLATERREEFAEHGQCEPQQRDDHAGASDRREHS